MPIVRSKVTSQGQISVPMIIRRKLGIESGSILEWEVDGDMVRIRRAGAFTSADIHKAVFLSSTPEKRSTKEMKEGIRDYVQTRYARR